MKQIDVESWEQFEEKLRILIMDRSERKSTTSLHVSPFMFRGQSSNSWQLTTTLERNDREKMPLKQYYRLISIVKPQIETFTGTTWDIMSYDEYLEWLYDNDTLMPGNFPAYDYIVYLRHHGFPSPLLDWTRSPYVAAYFAFRHTCDATGKVSIYVLWESPGGGKIWSSGEPHIHSLGPYVRSHRRHFLQQSVYTICLVRKEEWNFAQHEAAFARDDANQDLLWKFNIPAIERMKILTLLDTFRLNAF